jgi:purine-binding chemotaxis protein CheW
VTAGVAGMKVALQYLSFGVSGQHLGLLLAEIQEIVEYSSVTRVPAAPRVVLGVFNLRGNVVPVVDLAACLGLPRRPVGNRSCLIVLRERDREQSSLVALLADAVDNVLELGPDEIQAPPAVGTRVAPHLLTGVATRGELLFQLLSVERILTHDGLGTSAHSERGLDQAEP